MLACIKLRYAMRLPLIAANPCHVSLHLAAWAYDVLAKSTPAAIHRRVSLCGNYFKSCIFQLTFWCPSLWASVESFPFCMRLMRLSVYLLKDPVLYVCRDGCLLWGRCVFYAGCRSLVCRSVYVNSCMSLISAVIGHHLLIAACCDVLLKLGISCIKCVRDCWFVCMMHARIAITHTDRRQEARADPPYTQNTQAV